MRELGEQESPNVITVADGFEEPFALSIATALEAMDDSGNAGSCAVTKSLCLNLIRPNDSYAKGKA